MFSEFELNLVISFMNNEIVIKNFPIQLIRWHLMTFYDVDTNGHSMTFIMSFYGDGIHDAGGDGYDDSDDIREHSIIMSFYGK